MLLGEHAVLHGRRALVCAINQRITVDVFQCSEPILRVQSDLGHYESPLFNLADHRDFRFVLDAVKQYPLKQGLELNIHSDCSSTIGFGSSAAVTAAVHAALMGGIKDRMELFRRSLATIRRVQGRGSGADAAASVFGGVLAYKEGVSPIISVSPENTKIIGLTPEAVVLTAVYSGAKMKTADVIRLVENRRRADPQKYERIFDEMDASTGRVMEAFDCLGVQMIFQQKRMEEMGLCNEALGEIISLFEGLGTAAKISGSGLGDCAVGLGAFPQVGSFRTFVLRVEPQGTVIH